jgi:hypothetical protein
VPEQPATVSSVIRQLVETEKARLREYGIQERGGVSLAENQAVTVGPIWPRRIDSEDGSIEDRDEIGRRQARTDM